MSSPLADKTETVRRESVESDPKSGKKNKFHWWQILSVKRISAVYLAILLFAYFTYQLPDLFLRYDTWTTMLGQQSITIIVALGVLIPVTAGVFDMSVAYTMGLTSTVMAILMVNHHMSWVTAALLAILIGVVIGILNGLIIAYFKVSSLIATLGTGTVIGSIDFALSGGSSFPIRDANFLGIGVGSLFGIAWPVYMALALSIVAWFFLEHTAVGRRTYAIGGGIQAARLAGVPVRKYIMTTLVLSSVLGAIAGILLTARVGANSPGVAASFLLPGFAAVFLGATQLKEGRVNAWGTVIAILALAIGAKGFDLIGVRLWIHDFFYGIALIGAMAMSVWSKRSTLEPNGAP
ncbi:ABC transporter permease [Rhodococcus koreensis]|uniref:ABC transporter permease n=1 Tax=Rhodococcus koreensis TaxID=99653 RepID=UPI00366D93D1